MIPSVPTPPWHGKRNRPAGSILAYVLLMTGLLGCGAEETGVRPRLTSLTEAVYSAAVVRPRESYTVYAAVPGIIGESNLREGKRVRRGEVLLRVRGEQAELEARRARLQYTQAYNNAAGQETILHEMTIGLETAALQLANDSSLHARQARLWKQNIGSRQAYETARLRFETSRNRLRELHRTYARRSAELGAQLELARTALDQSRRVADDHLVRAERDGVVYEVLREMGESVTPQTPLARVGSTDDFLLRLSVDEVDIARVVAGQTVVVVLDAYGEQTFTATLTAVMPYKDPRTQTYTAEAEFERGPDRLFDGLAGEANIVVSRRQNVLTLPVECIGPDNTVRTAEGTRRVVTGVTDFRYTEIISGIDSATVVYQAE